MTGQSDDPKTPDIATLWRDQPTETPPMTLEQIHARGFQDHVRRRNTIEYVACGIVVATFSYYVLWLPDPVLKLASSFVALGAVFVAWQLHRRASARTAPTLHALDFHRAELVRQHEALSTAWAWYLAPFIPGLGLFVARISTSPAPAGARALLLASILVYGVVWVWNNRRAKRRLAAQIAEIDDLRRD